MDFNYRKARIEKLIHKIAGNVLLRFNDRNIGLITVTYVSINKAKTSVWLYVSFVRTPISVKDAFEQFLKERFHIINEMKNQLRYVLRKMPEFIFLLDDTQEKQRHIEAIFKSINDSH